MTISPPSQVKKSELSSFQILNSGFDTLYLAIDIEWLNDDFFDYLIHMKEIAVQAGKESAITLHDDSDSEWLFLIKPHGLKGYEWLLKNNDYSLDIGNWQTPQSRPSILVRISSETLWNLGPQCAVDRIISLLLSQSAFIKIVKVSRVDLCVDITFPADLWAEDLLKYRVTRSRKARPYYDGDCKRTRKMRFFCK